jgi:2',3'-cyclic-nucleotide 2'-phosphodiesterase/3'-nucleotidase
MFPFDNRFAVMQITGADLRRIIAAQAHARGRRAGFAGMRVFVDCTDGEMGIRILLNDGRTVRDEDQVRIAANDFLATNGDGILTPAMPAGGFDFADDPRLVRDVVANWLRQRGGSLNSDQFESTEQRRWNLPDLVPASCTL